MPPKLAKFLFRRFKNGAFLSDFKSLLLKCLQIVFIGSHIEFLADCCCSLFNYVVIPYVHWVSVLMKHWDASIYIYIQHL